MSQNPEIIKEKIDNFEHMEIINVCLAKQKTSTVISKGKYQMMNVKKKMLTTLITAKGVIFPIFKDSLEISKKRTSNPTETWAKAMNRQYKGSLHI